MSTMGDRVLNISLPKIGEKSLFTRDLEEALRTGGVDFVVHSLKDLPTALPTGMAIGAILEREDARDALVLRKEFDGHTIDTLPKGSVIGTSSLRRTAQIRRQYPHLQVCDIRGNLNTRLAKLDAVDSKYAGIVLAQAGLMRMGWLQRISQVLEPVDLLYAVGQGALAVECRSNDEEVLGMLRSLMCLSTTCRILAERSFLKTLGGGCSAPVAVCSTLTDHVDSETAGIQCLSLTGAVWSLDGITQIRDVLSRNLHNVDINSQADSVDGEQPQPKRARRSTLETQNEIIEKVIVENQTIKDVEDELTNNNNNNNNNDSSTSSSSSQASSCEIINEDADVEKIAHNYNMQELLNKHMNLAKQCPVLGVETENGHKIDIKAAGDGSSIKSDIIATSNAVNDVHHCPLKIEVGQDFMGVCPFVGKEEKIAIAASGKCPITGNKGPTLKCPFSSITGSTTTVSIPLKSNNSKTITTTAITTILDNPGDGVNVKSVHAKCPFLQQANKVQMFDYADEEQPQPSQRSHDTISLPASECFKLEDSLFCGFYAHACYNRELFDCCHKLGQQLAEQLIKQGALNVMKCAQNEIHGKIQ